ncbi:hypothetical protein [Nocardioides panzhihuensis]|uniref:Uncharacterized protein n=1 Tax=Nocardioides panzhihuensis TaxID=860243 RepID=A0A7Z0IVA8_9ACTN|nr:hypothetical protein [Nocardioides panzhihuensis]NYI80613.1 hypothetical protein [Nocardioides panzhihuensis]
MARGGAAAPEMSRLLSVELPALYDAAYDLTRRAAIRAGVDVWAFTAAYGLGLTMPGESPQLSEVVILARQNHHLTDSSGPCRGVSIRPRAVANRPVVARPAAGGAARPATRRTISTARRATAPSTEGPGATPRRPTLPAPNVTAITRCPSFTPTENGLVYERVRP